MKTFDISKHFSELDRSILVGENAYQKYFKHVAFVFDSFLSALEFLEHDEPFEHEILEIYARNFLQTLSLFRFKFIENINQPMLVDVTESGYPNSIELKRLQADKELADQYLSKTEKSSRLKHEILEHLIKKQTQPENLLHQTGLRLYYEQIKESYIFESFNQGELKQIESNNPEKERFLYHWATFDDVLNRPFIYILVFDFLTSIGNSDRTPVFETIKKRTVNTAPLKVIAADIDHDIASVQPKILKRIDLGPIHNHFARDEHPLTKVVQEHFGEDDFIFQFNTEIIFSKGEMSSNNFLSKGEIFQIFHVDDSNMECMERMVSSYQRYMITSHRVLQYLKTHFAEDINKLAAPPYIYKTDLNGKK